MKHFFITSFLLVSILFSTVQTSHAVFPTFDALQYATQIPQYAKDIINTAANVATQVNTYYTFLQSSVLDPLATALVIATQLQQQNNTINLITGSLGGNSLLVQNPEQWIKNKGLNSVRINIGDVSQQNGTYSSSILGSIINTYRGSSDLRSTLNSLGNSSIPNIVQNNLCKDTSLSNVAKNDVMKSDGTYDLEAFQNRKQDLFNSLCVGNPSVNIQLGQRLTAVGKQRPDVAGMDSLLAVSFGDNEYSRSVKAQTAIAKEKEAKEEAAINDLNRGGGIASATKCDQPVAAEESGISNIPCRIELITNAGSILNDAFLESVNGSLKNGLEGIGPGAGQNLASLLRIFTSARGLLNPSDKTPVGTSPPAQDITSPAEQKETSDFVRSPLKAHLSSLNSLENTERGFSAELSAYQNTIQSVQKCYEDLVKDYNNAGGDPRVISALGFTSGKLTVIANTKTESTKNLNSINTTRTLINDTLVSVSASNSTMEITRLFTDYQKKIEDQRLPSLSSAPRREGDISTFRGDIVQETNSLGTIPALTTQCADIRRSYEQSNQSGGDGGSF